MQLEERVQQLSRHVKMMELELRNLKRRNNQLDERASKRRKLNVDARVLASDEGMQLAAEKEQERAAKAEEQKDTGIRRKQQAAESEQQRRDRPADQPSSSFTGALNSKKKPDLQEIAGALNLSEDGTREALILRINTFFEQKPDRRDDPQFLGLFNRASKRRAPASENPTPDISNLQSLQRDPLTMDILNVCGAAPQ
jgi:hypothetical protein